jgi:uncharacterized protein (TIGR02246 family)
VNIREEIESLTRDFAQAATNKDLDAMVAFYEEGARFLPPGAPMAQGRTAIRDVQQRIIERGVQALELETVDVIEAGEFFIEIGRVTVTIRPPGASSAMTDHGKSVVVWRRQADGTLKIVVDTFNSNGHP